LQWFLLGPFHAKIVWSHDPYGTWTNLSSVYVSCCYNCCFRKLARNGINLWRDRLPVSLSLA
jgi:hypothetical protein